MGSGEFRVLQREHGHRIRLSFPRLEPTLKTCFVLTWFDGPIRKICPIWEKGTALRERSLS